MKRLFRRKKEATRREPSPRPPGLLLPPIQFDSEWHCLPKDIGSRTQSAVAVLDEKHVIFVGGYNYIYYSDAVTMVNIETGVSTELAKLNRKKSRCKAIIVHRLLFVFGGWNGSSLTDVEVLDLNESSSPSKRRFQLLNDSPLPQSLASPTLVADDDFIYVIGGEGDYNFLDTLYRIHIASKTWTIMPVHE